MAMAGASRVSGAVHVQLAACCEESMNRAFGAAETLTEPESADRAVRRPSDARFAPQPDSDGVLPRLSAGTAHAPSRCMQRDRRAKGMRTFPAVGLAACVLSLGCASQSAPAAPPVRTYVEPPRPAGGVQTLSGEVLGVDRVPNSEQNSLTLHLNVDPSAPRPLSVSLGPGWYFDQAGIHFDPHEHIRVRGSEQLLDGRRVFVVDEIQKGQSLRLIRTPDGSWIESPNPSQGGAVP